MSTKDDCNPMDGKCDCLEGHTGRECNNCTFGYKKNEHGHCSGNIFYTKTCLLNFN